MNFLKLIILFFGIFISSYSLANSGNYNSILIGDQAAGMGGAYTALHYDASALAWYNPATLALLKGRSVSASVGIYKKFDTLYDANDNVSGLTQAGLKANQGFFRPLPSSTGSVARFDNETLKDWTLGFSILTPHFDSFKGDISRSGDNNSTLNMTDESLWVGLGAGKKYSEKEAYGFSLYYTARNFTKSVTDRTYSNSTTYRIYQEERDYTQNAITMIFGYHRILANNLKLGLSARPFSVSVAGKGTYSAYDVKSGSVQAPQSATEVTTKGRVPQKYVLGVAYEWPKLKVSGDLAYYSGMSYSDLDEISNSELLKHNSVWQAALGLQWDYREWLLFRTGVFSNLSAFSNPEIDNVSSPATQQQGDRIDMLGWSFNAAFRKGNIEYTFGGYYIGGWGRSVQRVSHEYKVVPISKQVFTMLVGTSYSFD
jgi:hypothetical protein